MCKYLLIVLGNARREDFLLSYYERAWENINRADEAAWKMFAAFAGLFAGISFLFDRIGTYGFLLIIIFFSFLGIAFALSGHIWFLRNIMLISNFEMEFLDDDDYGITVPTEFKKRLGFFSPHAFEVWGIFIFSYLSICILLIIFFINTLNSSQSKDVMVFTILCFSLDAGYTLFLYNKYKRISEDAPGKSPLTSPNDKKTSSDN